MPMSNWDGCWVISTKNPYECWLIDDDERKPIYLKDDYPQYDRQQMFEYRLANQTTEEYLEKYPPSTDWEGQISIEDWLRENGGAE